MVINLFYFGKLSLLQSPYIAQQTFIRHCKPSLLEKTMVSWMHISKEEYSKCGKRKEMNASIDL